MTYDKLDPGRRLAVNPPAFHIHRSSDGRPPTSKAHRPSLLINLPLPQQRPNQNPPEAFPIRQSPIRPPRRILISSSLGFWSLARLCLLCILEPSISFDSAAWSGSEEDEEDEEAREWWKVARPWWVCLRRRWRPGGTTWTTPRCGRTAPSTPSPRSTASLQS
jgi:hypothetical protein